MTKLTDINASVKSVVTRLFRNGETTILWTPTIHMGVGNLFYIWLWAHQRQTLGHPDKALLVESMKPWLPFLPEVASLVIDQKSVRFRDKRIITYNQAFGDDFTEEDIDSFAWKHLFNAPAFSGVAEEASDVDPGRVVINVRRGDYYSNLTFRGMYAFDLDSYIREAITVASKQKRITGIHIVSDGLDWCKQRLNWLADYCGQLTFEDPSRAGILNLRTIATARRLILTNSTFSYWGGYLSNVLHIDNHPEIIAPRFHARHLDYPPYHLNPRWTVIDDIPGGWDS